MQLGSQMVFTFTDQIALVSKLAEVVSDDELLAELYQNIARQLIAEPQEAERILWRFWWAVDTFRKEKNYRRMSERQLKSYIPDWVAAIIPDETMSAAITAGFIDHWLPSVPHTSRLPDRDEMLRRLKSVYWDEDVEEHCFPRLLQHAGESLSAWQFGALVVDAMLGFPGVNPGRAARFIEHIEGYIDALIDDEHVLAEVRMMREGHEKSQG